MTIQDTLQKTKKILNDLMANKDSLKISDIEDLRQDIAALIQVERHSEKQKALQIIDNEIQSLLGLRPFSGHAGTHSPSIIINEIYGILYSMANGVSPIVYDPYQSSWQQTTIRRPSVVKNG